MVDKEKIEYYIYPEDICVKFALIHGIVATLIQDIKNYCQDIIFETNWNYSPLYWNYVKNKERNLNHSMEAKNLKTSEDDLTSSLSIIFCMVLLCDYYGVDCFYYPAYKMIYDEQRIVFPKVLTNEWEW